MKNRIVFLGLAGLIVGSPLQAAATKNLTLNSQKGTCSTVFITPEAIQRGSIRLMVEGIDPHISPNFEIPEVMLIGTRSASNKSDQVDKLGEVILPRDGMVVRFDHAGDNKEYRIICMIQENGKWIQKDWETVIHVEHQATNVPCDQIEDIPFAPLNLHHSTIGKKLAIAGGIVIGAAALATAAALIMRARMRARNQQTRDGLQKFWGKPGEEVPTKYNRTIRKVEIDSEKSNAMIEAMPTNKGMGAEVSEALRKQYPNNYEATAPVGFKRR